MSKQQELNELLNTGTKNHFLSDGYIKKIVTGKGVIEILITPDMASKILKNHNGNNRVLTWNTVMKYSEDMSHNRWISNQQNQWFAFYEDGNLADGQHRLAAIIKSGKPLQARIERGLPKEAALVIDAHKARTALNQITINGETPWIDQNAVSLAKMTMYIYSTSIIPSTQTILEFCNLYQNEIIFTSNAFTKATLRGVTTIPVKTAVMLASFTENEERLYQFPKILFSGIITGERDIAATKLRDKLLTGNWVGGQGKTRADLLKMTMRVIKAFCDEQPLYSLRIPENYIYELPMDSPFRR